MEQENRKRRHIIIYHKNCMDGFTAAWVAHRALSEIRKTMDLDFEGEIELLPSNYSDKLDLERIRNASVYVLDFSYKKDTVLEALKVVRDMVIIDHHENAMQDLIELGDREDLPKLMVVFDKNKSGAGLTWDHFYGHTASVRPKIVDYVEDRDIWKFALPGSKEISDYLFTYEFNLETWDRLKNKLDHPDVLEECITIGKFVRAKRELDIKALVKSGVMQANIGGYIVPVVNAPYFLASETCEYLYTERYPEAPFVATYTDNSYKRIVSLRSRKDTGIDVSAIARMYDGNGHVHASGFRINHDSYYMDDKILVFLETEKPQAEIGLETPDIIDITWNWMKSIFKKVAKWLVQKVPQGYSIYGFNSVFLYTPFHYNGSWGVDVIMRLPFWQWTWSKDLSNNREYAGWHNYVCSIGFLPIIRKMGIRDVALEFRGYWFPSKDCKYVERKVEMKPFSMEAVEAAIKAQE